MARVVPPVPSLPRVQVAARRRVRGVAAEGESRDMIADGKDGWRPIETAPRTSRGPFGPNLICAHSEKRWIRFGRYDQMGRRWLYSGTSERSQWAQVEGDAPTHWMPLPEPPGA